MERIFHLDFAGRKSAAYYSTSKADEILRNIIPMVWEKSAQNPHEKLTVKSTRSHFGVYWMHFLWRKCVQLRADYY